MIEIICRSFNGHMLILANMTVAGMESAIRPCDINALDAVLPCEPVLFQFKHPVNLQFIIISKSLWSSVRWRDTVHVLREMIGHLGKNHPGYHQRSADFSRSP
jgi:hypothetical protein